jgi:hypothetical protein
LGKSASCAREIASSIMRSPRSKSAPKGELTPAQLILSGP